MLQCRHMRKRVHRYSFQGTEEDRVVAAWGENAQQYVCHVRPLVCRARKPTFLSPWCTFLNTTRAQVLQGLSVNVSGLCIATSTNHRSVLRFSLSLSARGAPPEHFQRLEGDSRLRADRKGDERGLPWSCGAPHATVFVGRTCACACRHAFNHTMFLVFCPAGVSLTFSFRLGAPCSLPWAQRRLPHALASSHLSFVHFALQVRLPSHAHYHCNAPLSCM